MKNSALSSKLLLIFGIFAAGTMNSAQAGALKRYLQAEPQPNSQTEKDFAREGIRELDATIQLQEQALARKTAINMAVGSLLGQPLDPELIETIKNPQHKKILTFLARPDLKHSVIQVFGPLLDELYLTYPREHILEALNESLAVERIELGKVRSAKSWAQRFIETDDNYAMERSNILIAQVLESHNSTPNRLDLIFQTLVGIAQANKDAVSKRLENVELPVGTLWKFFSELSALETEE